MTLEKLKEIKEQQAGNLAVRNIKNGYVIKVGMGTIGINNGAREVLLAFADKLNELNLFEVKLLADGHLVDEANVPVVSVVDASNNETLYGKVTLNDVNTIVNEHIVNGKVVKQLLIK